MPPEMRISKRPVTRSISSATLPFNLLLVSRSPSPRTNFGGDRQHPLEPGIGEDRAGDVADPGDRPRLQSQRHAHRPRRPLAPALGADVDEAGIVELHARRGQPIGIIERPNGPSSVHTIRTLRPVMLGNSALRARQVEADADAAIAIVGEVERAAASPPAATARSAPARRRECRSFKWPSPRTRTTGAVSRCSLPLRNCAARDLARQPVASGVGAQRQPRGRPAGQVERGAAAPPAPAAVAADRQVDRAPGPDDRRQQPVGRRLARPGRYRSDRGRARRRD